MTCYNLLQIWKSATSVLAGVGVAAVRFEFCDFQGFRQVKKAVLQSWKCCYTCYKYFLNSIEIKTVLYYMLVTGFKNTANLLQSCNKPVTGCNKKLSQVVTFSNPHWLRVL